MLALRRRDIGIWALRPRSGKALART